jgi:hypothetical protein
MNTNASQQTNVSSLHRMFIEAEACKQYSSKESAVSEFFRVDNTRYLVAPSPPTSGFLKAQVMIVENSVTFEQLRLLWQTERGATSSITEMAMCPSYQRIIAMGPEAIPLILRQMEYEGDQPDMWFWALQVLTGANPLTESQRGYFLEMANAWLSWARSRYVW